MLRNAIVVFAIVLVLGSSGLRPAHLPAAAVMVAVAGMMVFAAITLAGVAFSDIGLFSQLCHSASEADNSNKSTRRWN
jgi:hypothetical protein